MISKKMHRRYFKIAGITIQVESDLPIKDETFHPKFRHFEACGPGEDMILIQHHFSLPKLNIKDLGKEYYGKSPYAIYKKDSSWVYLGSSSRQDNKTLDLIVVFNSDCTHARIYNDKEDFFLKGNLGSLTSFLPDQVLLGRILADRQGCYVHSCGVNFQGKGLLFIGHSKFGKSTMARILRSKVEILCDDRIVVRRQPDGLKIYGTWNHSDVPDVSANSAVLKAILFLEKSQENKLIPMQDKKEIVKRLLPCLIRPFVTVDWWEKILSLVDKIVQEVPCYVLRFDKSRKVIDLLEKL